MLSILRYASGPLSDRNRLIIEFEYKKEVIIIDILDRIEKRFDVPRATYCDSGHLMTYDGKRVVYHTLPEITGVTESRASWNLQIDLRHYIITLLPTGLILNYYKLYSREEKIHNECMIFCAYRGHYIAKIRSKHIDSTDVISLQTAHCSSGRVIRHFEGEQIQYISCNRKGELAILVSSHDKLYVYIRKTKIEVPSISYFHLTDRGTDSGSRGIDGRANFIFTDLDRNVGILAGNKIDLVPDMEPNRYTSFPSGNVVYINKGGKIVSRKERKI